MTFAGETFDLAKISRKNVLSIRKRTGFVFQNYNLFVNKTALENITEGLIVGRGIKKGLAQVKAHELLARFSLTHREVQETADSVAPLFKKLVTDSITGMKTFL